MKRYLIIGCCLAAVICAVTAFSLANQYRQELDSSRDAHLEAARLEHLLDAGEIESYLAFVRSQYNAEPSEKSIADWAKGRYTLYRSSGALICGSGEASISPPDPGTIALSESDNSISATSSLSNDMYVVTIHSTKLEDMRTGMLNKLVSGCVIVFLCCLAALGTGAAVFYFYQKRLAKAINAVAAGDYSARVSGCGLADNFNAMARAVSDNVTQVNAAAQAQHDFVSNFSHELKTPLTAIIGYADLMRSAELDGEDSFIAASYIFSEGKRLESLSLKLMDMIVLDKQEFPLRPLPASKLLQHIAITVRPMLSTAELSLEFHAAAARIEGERDLLTTLVMNLLDNARKASANGGKIVLTGTVEGDLYRISIKDFGRGMPPEELNRITEAFYMVDKSRARAQHGAGLGLALAQRIAQLHGASLTFTSEVGKGTEVSFTLKKLPRTKEAANEE